MTCLNVVFQKTIFCVFPCLETILSFKFKVMYFHEFVLPRDLMHQLRNAIKHLKLRLVSAELPLFTKGFFLHKDIF